MCIVWLCACDSSCQRRPRVSDPLELESQALVSCLIWVLELKPGPIARAEMLVLSFGSQARWSCTQAVSTGPGCLSNRNPLLPISRGRKPKAKVQAGNGFWGGLSDSISDNFFFLFNLWIKISYDLKLMIAKVDMLCFSVCLFCQFGTS